MQLEQHQVSVLPVIIINFKFWRPFLFTWIIKIAIIQDNNLYGEQISLLSRQISGEQMAFHMDPRMSVIITQVYHTNYN